MCFAFLSFLSLPVCGVELADALPFLAERGGCVSAITFTSSGSASCTEHKDGGGQEAARMGLAESGSEQRHADKDDAGLICTKQYDSMLIIMTEKINTEKYSPGHVF